METRKFIQELIKSYSKLRVANESFVQSKVDLEKFQSLIDQRALIFEDLQILETEISNFFQRETKLETAEKLPLKILKIATQQSNDPEAQELYSNLLSELESLVLSDKAVEEFVGQQKAEVKAELNKVRRGKAIRGYAQTGPIGSCFINKIK